MNWIKYSKIKCLNLKKIQWISYWERQIKYSINIKGIIKIIKANRIIMKMKKKKKNKIVNIYKHHQNLLFKKIIIIIIIIIIIKIIIFLQK